MAAPMMIIQKAVQTGNELHIILYKSSRDVDISTFFLLSLNIDGEDSTVASNVTAKAESEGLSFSHELICVREERKLTINLSSDKKISRLEISDGERKRIIAVE